MEGFAPVWLTIIINHTSENPCIYGDQHFEYVLDVWRQVAMSSTSNMKSLCLNWCLSYMYIGQSTIQVSYRIARIANGIRSYIFERNTTLILSEKFHLEKEIHNPKCSPVTLTISHWKTFPNLLASPTFPIGCHVHNHYWMLTKQYMLMTQIVIHFHVMSSEVR